MDVGTLEKHYPAMESVLQERVLSRMREMNLKAAPLAKKAGLGDSFVRDILRGKTTVPKADNLSRLAAALDTTPEYLLGAENVKPAKPRPLEDGMELPQGRLPYGGKVRAGYFLALDDFNQDIGDHLVPPTIPRHPSYPQLEQCALLVEGDSMDQAGILEGMWAVVAPYGDYVDKIGELDNGNYVVVERSRAGGSEVERTIKEVQFARRGMRLVPRSSNPVHKEFFIDLDHEADNDSEQVRIWAVVLWAVRDMDPRTRK